MYQYFTIFFLIYISNGFQIKVSEPMRKKLDSEEEKVRSCETRPGCEQPHKNTEFEIKSIIMDCPNQQCQNGSYTHTVVQHNKTPSEKLTECKQKLLLTIKITNEGVPNDKSQYVIIDHITDATTLKKVKILNPYAVRIRQDPMLQVYDLQFERAVNAEAKENVYNKHDRNYRGCNIGIENPTCGLVQHGGKVVPYSTGFCCSCNPEKNLMEENQKEVQWPVYSDVPGYHKLHADENHYEPYKHYGFTGQDSKMVYEGIQKRADKSVNYGQFTELKDGKVRQRRGGQSCDDIDLKHLPESFHESTHCLTFSNLWYSVYRIKKPRIAHRLRIQIFQKYEDCHGETHWMDLTQRKVIELGTAKPIYLDKDFIAKYTSEDIDMSCQAIDFRNLKLLIPEKRVVDPDQFMLVPRNMFSDDGKSCDKIGVGYEAFYHQQKRCSVPPGSCLKNQPQHLHTSDCQAEQEGRKGNYFLKFFGTLATDPIGYNSTGQIQFLKMVYTKKHICTLYFELNADLITLLKPNAFATITEVYSDATNPNKARLIIKVTNSGLMFGVFYVRLSGCPLDVPASFNNIGSKSVLIPPQHEHIFNLFIEYPLPVKEFYCSIHVHNMNQELIAVRPIRVHTYDRCICIWHCECACYITDKGLKCTPMSLNSYHAAGFQGGFPTATQLVESSYLDEMLAMFFNMFMFLILTLLIMGLIKALIGLCNQEIGIWGLDVILGIEKPVVMCENKDCEYREDIGISVAGQFCLNVMFFFLYPLALFNICIKKYCFSKYTDEGSSECSCEEKWVNYECDDDICAARSSKSSVNMDRKSSRGTVSNVSLQYTTSEDNIREEEN